MSRNFRGIKSQATFDNTNSYKISANSIMTNNIVSENIQSSSFSDSYTNTVVHTELVPNGTYTINPSGVHNYILVFDIIDNTNIVNFSLDAVTTSATINDKVTVMFKIAHPSTHNVNMTLSSEFYYTQCGDVSPVTNIGGNERYVIEFIFDGEKYVNTNDNC